MGLADITIARSLICGPDSLVVIGGDVTARALNTDGEFCVVGSLSADVVYGYYNDNSLLAGTIRARLVIEDDHSTEAIVQADHHFDIDTFQQGYGAGVQERLRELLVSGVFTTEDRRTGELRLDRGELFRRLREGDPVFRAG